MFKRIILIFLGSILLVACAPKLRKEGAPVVTNPTQPVKVVEAEKELPKFTEANISLILPFELNKIDLSKATKAQVGRADLAIDFSQGFMLGIDSANKSGLNFKVHVYDSQDDNVQLSKLAKLEALHKSNLIVGPVFPAGIKHLTKLLENRNIPMLSPLAATKPSEFDNPKLISIVNAINLHSEKIASYIGSKFSSSNGIVVLINTKKTDDEEFAQPIREYLAAKYPNLVVQEFSSANVFETKMIKGKKYAVVVCSSDRAFVVPTIDKIAKIARLRADDYSFQLFGHPNWAKQSYNIEQLQSLQAIITSSYHINYKDSNVINFIKKYRSTYSFEPNEYAFKGFDIGYYVAKMLAKHGQKFIDFLTKENYKGLHNSFNFAYSPEYGYYNKALFLMQYKNLTLTVIN